MHSSETPNSIDFEEKLELKRCNSEEIFDNLSPFSPQDGFDYKDRYCLSKNLFVSGLG